MKLEDLTNQEVAILCRFIRGQSGTSVRGGVTIDTHSAVRGLPTHLQGGATGAVESLYRKGFFSRKPKRDDFVYSLRTALPPDLESIVHALQADPALCERARTPETEALEPTPPRILPDILDRISGMMKKQKWVRMVSLEEAADIDFVDEDERKTYFRATLHLEVTCPSCKRIFQIEIIVGSVDLNGARIERCPQCWTSHTFRGPCLIF